MQQQAPTACSPVALDGTTEVMAFLEYDWKSLGKEKTVCITLKNHCVYVSAVSDEMMTVSTVNTDTWELVATGIVSHENVAETTQAFITGLVNAFDLSLMREKTPSQLE